MALLLNPGFEPCYKLSKPRTRTSGVCLEPRSDLEASYSRESSPITSESHDTIRSRYSARHSVRESLYGDGTKLRKEEDSNDDDEWAVKPKRKRFSRTNTAVSKRASMRISLGLSRSSTVDTRDGPRTQDDEHTSDAIQRRVERDRMLALNQSLEATIDDSGVRERIISPIRRRSFFTPGLATRNPVDMLAKPPRPTKKQQAEQEYYYNPNLSVSSPLERIAALDLANRPTTPFERVGTPGDHDYGMIGRLRITNGVASPAPSARSGLRKSTALRNSVNYFDMQSAPSWLLPAANPVLQEARRSGDFTFAADSIHDQLHAEVANEEVMNYADVFGPPATRSAASEAAFGKRRSKSFAALPTFRDRTSLLAQDYMSALADNPFDRSQSQTPVQLEATTKPSAVEDALFDDQQSLNKQDSFESLARLNLLLPDVPTIASGDFAQEILASIGNPTSRLNTAVSKSAQNECISSSKEDSGYNSSSSITSYTRETAFPEHVSMITVANQRDNPETNPQATIKPRRRPTPVTISSSFITNQDSVFSSPMNSSSTIFTMATTTSGVSSISKASASKKLQKARTRSQPPPMNRVSVQMHPEIDPDQVPLVPGLLADRMAKRAVDIPPLEHTLPSTGHLRQDSGDLHRPPLSAPLRFPSPQSLPDRVCEQVTGGEISRPKPIQSRHSFLGTLHGMRSTPVIGTKNAMDSGHSGPPNSKQKASQRAKNGVKSSVGVHTRSKSMATVPNEARLPRQDSNQSTNCKAVAEPGRSIRKSPSINTGSAQLFSASMEEIISRDAQRKLSTLVTTTERELQSDIQRAVSLGIDTTRMPCSQVAEDLTKPEMNAKPRGLRKSSSESKFDNRVGRSGRLPESPTHPKHLPPLPLFPDEPVKETIKLYEETLRKIEALKKDLPPLPHQRMFGDTTRGLSPCRETLRESMDLSTVRETRSKDRYAAIQKRLESSRMYSEPQDLIHLHQRSLPKLPRPEKSSRRSHDSNRPRLTRSASPERSLISWDSSPAMNKSWIPAITEHKWVPQRPQTLQRQITVWPTGEASPQQPNASHLAKGSVASLSGRFEGGLGYNYEPGYGITGSAGTRGNATGMRKSIERSKDFGLDLTDIPIFVTQRL